MKKITLFLLFILFFGCTKQQRQRIAHLPEARFSRTININLPLYSNLKSPLNPVVIENEGVGLRGIIVMNTGTMFVAWDRACPHLELRDCSTANIENQIFAVCPCDGVRYNLVNGSPSQQDSKFSMLSYRVSVNGNLLTISN